ncbi:MAG: carboxypeptidase regulatory-like domain-containing protein [Pyrinomonadaceae bacterium]|nr:carboxypeptidase regulatory-like domain-containing protein [Pyrinomonadaceae bacterium]
MFRKTLFSIFAVVALLSVAFTASAQTGELRGQVTMNQADGTKVPASDVVIDVYRTDISGKYNTKTNKKGEFVFAGLPYVGDYVIGASHPSARPTYVPGVKVGRGTPYEITLTPGDGKRLTLEEIKAAEKNFGGNGAAGTPAAGSPGDKAKSKAELEELARKNAEIEARNKKIEESNVVVERAFKAGNTAFDAKNYDEAVKQYDEGLAADPEQPALLTQKSAALKARGVERYNAAITSKDEAAKGPGIEAAKGDFRASAEAIKQAVNLLNAQPAPTDPQEQARFTSNKIAALSTRAEAMRLFVTKVDLAEVEAGEKAFADYLAVETDPARKLSGQRGLAQMLFDANSFDKSLAEYQKILATNPDDTDALVKSGMLLFNIGAVSNDKAKYQEAANFLQQFVDKAPDTDKLKADAKAILEELKNQQNVKAEKTTPTPARRRRP